MSSDKFSASIAQSDIPNLISELMSLSSRAVGPNPGKIPATDKLFSN